MMKYYFFGAYNSGLQWIEKKLLSFFLRKKK